MTLLTVLSRPSKKLLILGLSEQKVSFSFSGVGKIERSNSYTPMDSLTFFYSLLVSELGGIAEGNGTYGDKLKGDSNSVIGSLLHFIKSRDAIL